MQSSIIILFVLSVGSLVLQENIDKTKLATWLGLVLIGIFLYLVYPYAIEQSYTQFQALMADTELMSRLMVLQIAESILGILLSIFLIRKHYNEPIKPFFYHFRHFPGLIFILALFYAESLVFLNVHGMDFKVLAILISLCIPVVLLVFKFILMKIIPEYDIQLELKFIIHILQLIIGIILSIQLFRLPTTTNQYDLPTMPIIALLSSLLIIGSVGMLWYHFKMRRLSWSLIKENK